MTHCIKTLPYWLASLYLFNLKPRAFLEICEKFQKIEQVFSASEKDLLAMGVLLPHAKAIRELDWKKVSEDLDWSKKELCHIVAYDSIEYPPLLKEIFQPPLVLFVQGHQNALLTSQLAIVGSRHASPQGLENAANFAYTLANAGLTITSGLALGIDAAAHRGALKANGLTIGVAGTGLNFCYPKAHLSLFKQIINQGGAILSEFPLATPPKPQNFPRRNRIISGLSKGTLVIEAALKSGSLITARHAAEQGREVFAIPGSIHNPLTKGCHHLLRQGAKLVEKTEDILEELGEGDRPPILQYTDSIDLPKRTLRVLEGIEYDITCLDMIISRSGLTAAEVSSILLTLDLEGYIKSAAGGYVREIIKGRTKRKE